MGYRYELFTEEGQRTFIRIRDRVKKLLGEAGAVRIQEAASHQGGDSWFALACFDRMVELGDISEVCITPGTPAQHRVFVGRG
jgi:hypothetical protein